MMDRRLRVEAETIDSEINLLDYLKDRIEGDKKFESLELHWFFEDLLRKNQDLKEEFIQAIKTSKTELRKRSNNKKSLADIYEKINALPDTKTCPDCGQTMFKKGMDEFRQVYECSLCPRKEFYKDGKPFPDKESEEKDNVL